MKHRLFHLFVLLALLGSLAGTGSVRAQQPQPPVPPAAPTPPGPLGPFAHPPFGPWQPTPASPPSAGFDPEMRARFASQASPAPGGPAVVNVPLGSSGLSLGYAQTFGVTDVPYIVDAAHLNSPYGVSVDASGSLYVTESTGSRLLRYDSSGTNTLSLGHAGVARSDGDYLNGAVDSAVRSSDGHIFVTMWSGLKEFDASGVLQHTFPADPWNAAADNGHFNRPAGLAFGPGGYLYLADSNNQRVQIFDVSAAPTYVGTIGTSGVTKTDNTGFNFPVSIAFDSGGGLYVLDSNNYRVQRCTSTSPWTAWTCATFFGVTGVSGTDLVHLTWGEGIAISSSDMIFIADSGNSRVLRCNTSHFCTLFAGTGVEGSDNNHLRQPTDVAVNASGQVFVADEGNDRVQKFDSSGTYLSTIGVTGVPYLTDASHLYTPWGVAAAPGGTGFFVTEGDGHRLIKYSAAGTQLWTVGQAGICGSDNAHLCRPLGNPAIDPSGNVYVPDSANQRVQIFNSSGGYVHTLGTTGSGGTGNNQFNWPFGVAISPLTGDIYVADIYNSRIQVFTSGPSYSYKTTLGVTGVLGFDNLHFNEPTGVAVDSLGNIYVADASNLRVQKCTLGISPPYTCSTFAGVTGVFGSDFSHLGWLWSVSVDGSNRVYVADASNNRVQVFDSTGAYLTTIGGAQGQGTSQFMSLQGAAVSQAGTVYTTDGLNERVQKYTPGVPGWVQSNINGFGDPSNAGAGENALSAFNGQLYAGTGNGTNAAQVWRTSDGSTWSQFSPAWSVWNIQVSASQTFGTSLYVGTGNSAGAEIWRTDGTTWTQVVSGDFGSGADSFISQLAVFSGQLYAVVANNATGEIQIYRSSTGNAGSWLPVTFSGSGAGGDTTFAVYGGFLYLGLARCPVSGPCTAELWHTSDGTTWTSVFTNGLSPNASNISSMAVYGGALYIGLRNVVTGAEVWKSTDGTTFSKMFGGGLGNADNKRPYGMIVYNCQLYLLLTNTVTGDQVWRSPNGSDWQQVGFGGWGDANNMYSDYYDKGADIFNDSLFIGTWNSANGGEIWRYGVAGATCASVNVSIGGTSREVYGISQGTGARRSYTSVNAGPAVLSSLNGSPILASLRVIYGGSSYSEMMGYPNNTATDFFFPWYNNVAMDSQLRISNLGAAPANITVTLGSTQIDSFSLLAGAAYRQNYAGQNGGPLYIHSSSPGILSTVRVLYGGKSYSEMMGYPDANATDFYFPWYNNVAMDSQLRISNLHATPANITVFLGSSTTPIDSFTLAGGAAYRQNYTGQNNGPLHVHSSSPGILSTIRVLYGGKSYSEMMGYPSNTSTDFYFPAYDNVNVDSQLRISNLGGTATNITVTQGSTTIDSFTLAAGAAYRQNYAGQNGGPLHVQSGAGPILATVRTLYGGASFYEMIGYPDVATTAFYFPWYNNVAMNSELRFAMP